MDRGKASGGADKGVMALAGDKAFVVLHPQIKIEHGKAVLLIPAPGDRILLHLFTERARGIAAVFCGLF